MFGDEVTERIPVTLISGFLGSGKTTLLNRLLRDAEFRDSAVLVNEIGEIGIDHLLIAAARDRVVLLDAGCLCCVMADSLRETLADLYHRRAQGTVPPFTRVLIETSGLADPGPIVQTLLKDALVSPLFEFVGLVVVVDALHAIAQLRESVEAREQVVLADRLIVSKLDMAADTSSALHDQLRALNPLADICWGLHADQPVAKLFQFNARTHQLLTHEHDIHELHAHHSHGIVSHALPTAGAVNWAGIAAWTGHLKARYGADLLRCKALLRLQGQSGCVVVHGVRGLFETRHDPELHVTQEQSVIVCIGRHLDRATLQAGLSWLQTPDGLSVPPSADFASWHEAPR